MALFGVNSGTICLLVVFEQEIDEVDLAALLVGGGVLLDEAGETDGVSKVLLGGGALLLPVGIGLAVGIGVGEDDHLAVTEREEFGGVEHRQSTGGHPQALGEELGTDDGGLLGLDDADGLVGVPGKQMEAEEASLGLEHRGEFALLLQTGGDPGGVPVLDTVTVVVVPHEFAVADTLFVVDLPEDYGAVLGLA